MVAAHAIMYIKFKDGIQDKYPIEENILLIEAKSGDEAWVKAERMGKEYYGGDADGTLTWEDRPASWVFAGFRKLISVISLINSEDKPNDRAEITYSEMEVYDEESLNNW